MYGELSEEIREHLEEKTDELVAGGMSREEATRRGTEEFGNVTFGGRERTGRVAVGIDRELFRRCALRIADASAQSRFYGGWVVDHCDWNWR